jgi:thiamine biosynthesis lipoprotein
VGPDGLSTDGVSSAAAILGPQKGLALVENTPKAAAFIVRMIDGQQKTYESKRWKELPRAEGEGRRAEINQRQ